MTRTLPLFLLLPVSFFVACDGVDRTPLRDDRPMEEGRRDVEAAGDRVANEAQNVGEAIENGAQEVGNEIDDVALTTSVKAALIGEDDLKAADITVRSENGVVHLTGTVPSHSEKARASTVAMGVKGVRRVENLLDIKG